MVEIPRYRNENDEPVVDIRLASVERLFDNRDPAPFRERDLDSDLVEYLIEATEDLIAHERIRIVFWLEKASSPSEIEAAFRAHFAYELTRLDRRRRRQRRTGWIALALAIVFIVLVMSVGELVAGMIGGVVGAGIKEGLVIAGWVLMWRPVELLVYDGIPSRRERRVLQILLKAPVEVRIGGNQCPTGDGLTTAHGAESSPRRRT